MNLAIHTGDEDIKQMLVENSMTHERPIPPNDVSICVIRDLKSAHVWLVVRFWNEDDPGYVAYGASFSTPIAEVRKMFALVLSQFQGKPGHYVELPPLAVN